LNVQPHRKFAQLLLGELKKEEIYSNVAEEKIAKQFPTERREMIFCAIPMTEKWPFFAYDDRKEAVLALDGYRGTTFFFSKKPIFFVLQLLIQLPMALIKIKFLIFFDRVPQLPAFNGSGY
jgi:hypothetical protein